MLPVGLFHLQILEEALADGIVIWVSLGGERLQHGAPVQQVPELLACVFAATVGMEEKPLRLSTLAECLLKCILHEIHGMP